jgi:hypothetical protein
MFWAFGRTIATFPPSFVRAQSYIIDRLTDEDGLGGLDVGGGTVRDEVGRGHRQHVRSSSDEKKE